MKEGTIFVYQCRYDTSISPYLGKIKIRKIERRHVIDMMEKVANGKRFVVGRAAGRKRKVPAKRTGKKIWAANYARLLLVAVLNSAVADDIIQRNVAETVPQMKRETPPARDNIHRELTDKELRVFFSYCQHSVHYPALKFLLYTGVRAGECAALQWRDINWKREMVHIRRTITKDKEGKWKVGETPKTKSSIRNIPMTPEIKEILKRQWDEYMAIHGVINLMAPVFPGEHGGYANSSLYGSTIRNAIDRAQKDGKHITNFSIHALRHTFASRAWRSGVPPKTLMEIMGHSSLATTMDTYTHVNEDDKKSAMERIVIGNF